MVDQVTIYGRVTRARQNPSGWGSLVSESQYYVWEESDGKHRQIWTARVNRDGTGWKSERRTKSPYGKYDPQFQIVGDRIYYVWHEDHGPTEPIWVAEGILVE